MDSKILSKWLDSSDFITKITALKTIEKQKNVELIPKIINLLKKDSNEDVRKQCAICLGSIGSEDVVLPLLDSIETDISTNVKEAGVISLGKLKYPSSLSKLIEFLDKDFSKNRTIRVGIVYAIGEIGINNENTRNVLINMLGDDDKEVRKEAIKSLEKIKEWNAQYLIINMVEAEPFVDVRLQALDTLSRIGGKRIINELEMIRKNITKEKFFEVRDKIPKVIQEIKKREGVK